MTTSWARVGPRLCWGRQATRDLHLRYADGLLDVQVGGLYVIVVVRRGPKASEVDRGGSS